MPVKFLTPDGIKDIADEDVDRVSLLEGYSPISDEGIAARAVESRRLEDFSSVRDKAQTFVEGGVSGLTFGLSDLGADEDAKLRAEANPLSRLAGQIGSAFLPIPGSAAGLTAKAAKGAANLGAKGGKVAQATGKLAAGGIEGAAGNVGMYLGDTFIQDKELSAEAFISEAGKGALLGGGVTAAFGVGQKGVSSIRRLVPKDKAAAAVAEAEARTAAKAQQLAVKDAKAAVRARLDEIRLGKTETQLEQAKIKLQQERVKLSTAEQLSAEKVRTASGRADEVEFRLQQKRDMAKRQADAAEAELAAQKAEDAANQKLAKDWAPGAGHEELAKKYGIDISEETQKMRDWAASKGAKRADWDAMFNNWIRRADEFKGGAKSRKARQAFLNGDDVASQADEIVDGMPPMTAEERANSSWRSMDGKFSEDPQLSGYTNADYIPYDPHEIAAKYDNDALALIDPEAAGLIKAMDDLDNSHAAASKWLGVADEAPAPSILDNVTTQADRAASEIVDGAPVGTLDSVADDIVQTKVADSGELMSDALKHDKVEDISSAIDAIGSHERALSHARDILGDAAPPSLRDVTEAYKAAEAAADARQMSQTIDAAERIKDAPMGVTMDAERAMAAAMPPSVPAPQTGMLGKVGNAAAVLEGLDTLGADIPIVGDILPRVKQIPVIGPMLGLYLKGKALHMALGRMGGRIPATFETRTAEATARAQQRVYNAVDGMLATTARGIGKAQRPSVIAASRLSVPLYGKKAEKDPTNTVPFDDRDGLYMHLSDRTREIDKALEPGELERAAREAAPSGDAELIAEIVNVSRRKLEFLQSKVPRPTIPPPPLSPQEWRPSLVEVQRFARYVDAVNDPVGVLERVGQGKPVEIEQAEALKKVFPRLFGAAQQKLLETASTAPKTVPYHRRVTLSLLFETPFEVTKRPEFSAFVNPPEEVQRQMQAAQSAAQAPQVNASQVASVKLDQRTGIALDAVR